MLRPRREPVRSAQQSQPAPQGTGNNAPVFLFRLNLWLLLLLLAGVLGVAAGLGLAAGQRIRRSSEGHREPLGTVQGTILGLVGLLLAFGLTMAVGRYEDRRALVVQEADAIGTTYLRASLLSEPVRGKSLDLLTAYADDAVLLADAIPSTDRFETISLAMESAHRDLWALASEADAAEPSANAPRLYIESLNEMIDAHSDRVASLQNRLPTPVVVLEIAGSAIALGMLALYLTLVGRSATVTALTGLVFLGILLVTLDLDRPSRGFITVPATPLIDARASMDAP